MLWLELVSIITTTTSTTIVVHTTQLLLSDTIYTPHTKQINMIWLVYCVTELVLLVCVFTFVCWLNSFVGVLLVFVLLFMFFCIFFTFMRMYNLNGFHLLYLTLALVCLF